MELRLPVHGDVAAVAGWWADSARRTELRVQYETPSVTGFSWSESVQGQEMIQIGEWSTARRLIRIRITTIMASDGCPVQRRTDGSFVREQEFRQVRRIPGGREDETLSRRFMEFTKVGPNQTSLFATNRVRRTGFPWWERAQIRTYELQHRWTHLHSWVSRCESDLEADSSNPVDRGADRRP
jgi:hypothetical protein